jgi:hypothetical protein
MSGAFFCAAQHTIGSRGIRWTPTIALVHEVIPLARTVTAPNSAICKSVEKEEVVSTWPSMADLCRRLHPGRAPHIARREMSGPHISKNLWITPCRWSLSGNGIAEHSSVRGGGQAAIFFGGRNAQCLCLSHPGVRNKNPTASNHQRSMAANPVEHLHEAGM